MRWCFFFFQAEDGIRDGRVTGVQTCALPILGRGAMSASLTVAANIAPRPIPAAPPRAAGCHRGRPVGGGDGAMRSEERRVGKEGRSRWGPGAWKKERGGRTGAG